MRTEDGARQYWEASLAWRGRAEGSDSLTIQHLFDALHPLYIHASFRLAEQANELGEMIVRCKRQRYPKPKRKLTNLVQLPIRAKQITKAA